MLDLVQTQIQCNLLFHHYFQQQAQAMLIITTIDIILLIITVVIQEDVVVATANKVDDPFLAQDQILTLVLHQDQDQDPDQRIDLNNVEDQPQDLQHHLVTVCCIEMNFHEINTKNHVNFS